MNEIKEGDIVIVTVPHKDNDPKEGQQVKVIENDHSSIPYLVEDYLDRYGWRHGRSQWVKDVKLVSSKTSDSDAISPERKRRRRVIG